MKKSRLMIYLALIFLHGCASMIVPEKDYDMLKMFGYELHDIKGVAYCQISTKTFYYSAICLLSNDGVSVFNGDFSDLKQQKGNIDVFKFEDNEFGIKTRPIAGLQIQIRNQKVHFGFNLSKRGISIDHQMTYEWFDHIKANGGKEFVPAEFMIPPTSIYIPTTN